MLQTMHILFVHGVATRRTADYETHVVSRREAFTQYLLSGKTATFFDPYWGDFGAAPNMDFKSIPQETGTELGFGESHDVSIAPKEQLAERTLLDAARVNFAGILNSLSITLVAEGNLQAQELADKIGVYAGTLDRGDDVGIVAPGWLNDIKTDNLFLERLRSEVDTGKSSTTLGFEDWLNLAGRRMLGVGIDLVEGPAVRLVRGFTPQVARFIGDVFVYLKEGDSREKIRSVVTKDLVNAAISARNKSEKLVVVGHSMGAIILYDILSDPTAMAEIDRRAGAPVKIDLLLTVGTQIGLFTELGLFEGERLGGAAAAPPSAKFWWHVFNQMDVLSFAVEGIVTGASQFSIDTSANIVDAHSAYFISPVFYQRLKKRMNEVGLLR